MSAPGSRTAVLKQAYFGLNLLSFCFNWDNYALLPVLYPRITSPHFANDSAITYGWVGARNAKAVAAAIQKPGIQPVATVGYPGTQ